MSRAGDDAERSDEVGSRAKGRSDEEERRI